MFKEIVDDARRTPDIGRSQKLTMSTLCSCELKERIFKKFFMSIQSPFTRAKFHDGSKFCTVFENGHPRNIPVKVFQNLTSSSKEKVFKEVLRKFHSVAMATRVSEQFLWRTSQGTFLLSLVGIGLAVWEENMFKEIVDEGQRTTA